MEKINNEVAGIKGNSGFAQAIAIYIYKKCESDQGYKARVELEEKTLDTCLKYIMGTVKKMSQNASMAAATDEEVYKLVDDYYTKENAELDIPKKVVAKVQTSEESPKEPYTKVDPPEKVVKPKVEKSILTKKVKERDPLTDNQVSLFDLLG